MYFSRILSIFTITFGFMLLAGCGGGANGGPGTMAKIRQIIADPSLEVGKSNVETASVATITAYAEPDANRTDYGDAPIELWVFELTDPDELMSADFMDLVGEPKQTLSTSYIKHYKKQVVAGRSTVLAPFDIDDRTRYLGVAAGYANIDAVNGGRWSGSSLRVRIILSWYRSRKSAYCCSFIAKLFIFQTGRQIIVIA